MGWGDELLAAGQARKLHEHTKRRVMITDAAGRVRQNALWNGNPYIVQHFDDRADRIVNAPGHRPYILRKEEAKWVWRPFETTPAEVFLSEAERQTAAALTPSDTIIIEPEIKPKASPNKRWIEANWVEVIGYLRELGFNVATVGPAEAKPWRDGVRHIVTGDVRLAATVMERAVAYVGVEGFLHHAAAAMGTPAVVIMGGYIGPKITGYDIDSHRYLTGGAEPCGARLPCEHCRQAMKRITAATVINALKEVIRT